MGHRVVECHAGRGVLGRGGTDGLGLGIESFGGGEEHGVEAGTAGCSAAGRVACCGA